MLLRFSRKNAYWSGPELRLIKDLCNLIGVSKSRTTPYYPMGNGAVELFNQTLLKMLGTLQNHQKADWKSYVQPLVQAYFATKHDMTGYSPHYPIFGWHPRLAVEAYLGLDSLAKKSKNQEHYVDNLKKRLDYAYKVTRSNMERNIDRYKKNYDSRVRNSKLEVVLVNISVKTGKTKLSDKWERDIYIIVDIPIPEIPVNRIQKESGKGKVNTLQGNLLLQSMYISDSLRDQRPENKADQRERSRVIRHFVI
jgi:hypothetical protein